MIGLFDSGSGGLSVLSAIRRLTPQADVVYFGDTAHVPYGEKSAEDLSQLTVAGMAVLKSHGVSEIVSACNSVSYSVLQGAAGHSRVIEMTRPLARAVRAYAGKRALLLATTATIRSRIYADAIGVTLLLDTLPIPELAGAIEAGEARETIAHIIRKALINRQEKKFEVVILGCTHYPLVRDAIEDIASEFWRDVLFIDPADAVATEIQRSFNIEGRGTTRFLLSRDSEIFRKRAHELFPEGRYTIDVLAV